MIKPLGLLLGGYIVYALATGKIFALAAVVKTPREREFPMLNSALNFTN